MERTIVWHAADGFGCELVEVSIGPAGVRANGTLIRRWPFGPLCVDYEVRCDATWKPVGAAVTLRGLEPRSLEVHDLHGASDLDIAACAFTNTIPIRRLNLEVGQSATLEVAFVAIPELRVDIVPQRYTRLDLLRYRYEGLSTGFTAEITVDEDGLVVDYPRLCRRIWPGE